MSHWNTWKIAKIAIAAVAVLSLTAAVAASPAGAQEEPAAADQPARGHQGSYFTLAPSSEVTAPAQNPGLNQVRAALIFSSCLHEGESDDLHYSSSSSGIQQIISVHGWWNILNDDCPDKADVWVKLQAWQCTSWLVFRRCDWEDLNKSPTRRIKAKHIKGVRKGNYRVTARHTCASDTLVTWRAVVDVDIPGQIDGSEKYYSDEFDFECYPAV